MMLASDSDNESEYESDSSSETGPLRQVWGNRNLKGTAANYDFSTALPEDGEQFLLAVRNERNRIPTCVAADMTKITEIKRRKSEDPKLKTVSAAEGDGTNSIPETLTGETNGSEISDKMQKLKLQEPGLNCLSLSPKTDEIIEKAVGDLAEFLPTPAWRANRLSQFQYIRTKMDLTRDMMLQGRVYLVPSFTKFERDRIYWLRYCFGTLGSAKMIEIKRSRKVRAKEIYEEIKKSKLASQVQSELEMGKKEEDDSENDSDDSEVHIVSMTELQSIVPIIPEGEKSCNVGNEVTAAEDDLMKISGGSMDELVVVHPPEVKSEEFLQQPESILEKSDNYLVQTLEEPLDLSATVEGNELDHLESQSNTLPRQHEGALEHEKDEFVPDAHAVFPNEISSAQAMPADEGNANPDRENTEDEFVDPTAELKKLNGHQPTGSLLVSMPQRLLEYLLTLQMEWLKEFGFINRQQGNWLFAVVSALQVPFESDVISDLRQIALQCVKIRDKTKEYILWAKVHNSSEETSILSPVYESIGDGDDFGPEDVIASCNLFISTVVDFFVQKDLNKYLTLDGKSEF